MGLFANAKEIGYLNENKINWYNFKKHNQEMQSFLKSGNFAISNRTIDFVNHIFKGICNSEITNNILAYILCSIYLTEYNTENIIKLYTGIILYNKNLVLNVDNSQIEENIIELIQNNIIKHFTFIRERFITIKKDLKNISIPEIPSIQKLFDNEMKNSQIENNPFYYKSHNINENENLTRKKLYLDYIKNNFGMDVKDINTSLRSLYLKKEYLEEIINTHTSYHNIETLNMIDEFN